MMSVPRLPLIVGALIPWFVLQNAQPAQPTADSLLAAAESAYSKVDAFAATGWSESEIGADEGSAKPEFFCRRELDLFFQRPDTLLFMLVHTGEDDDGSPAAFMLNAEGGEAAYTSSAWPARIEQSALKDAVGGTAEGISGHATSVIGGLLLPDVMSKFRVRDIHERTLVGEETIRGVECWKIAGKFGGSQRAVSLWLDRSTGHVWQAVLEQQGPGSGQVSRDTLCFESIREQNRGERSMHTVIASAAR